MHDFKKVNTLFTSTCLSDKKWDRNKNRNLLLFMFRLRFEPTRFGEDRCHRDAELGEGVSSELPLITHGMITGQIYPSPMAYAHRACGVALAGSYLFKDVHEATGDGWAMNRLSQYRIGEKRKHRPLPLPQLKILRRMKKGAGSGKADYG